jgi:amicyanin
LHFFILRALCVAASQEYSMKLHLLFFTGVAAIAVFAAALTYAQDQASSQAVKIDNFSFSPATLTIPAGTTVKWTNHDDIPHNVVAPEQNGAKSFKSPVLDTDEEFSYKFDKPGTYSYFCAIHPKMTGKIVVQ